MLTADQAHQRSTPAQQGEGDLLAAGRDLVSRCLGTSWRALAAALDTDLQERCEAAGERELQLFLGRTREKLLAGAAQLEASVAASWCQEFEAALGGRFSTGAAAADELQLIDLADFDEDLAAKALARAIDEACSEDAYAVARRVAVLSGARRGGDLAPAASPEVFAAAVRRSLAAAGFGLAERLELLRCLMPHAEEGFAPIYREWNEQLKRRDVLPELKRAYGRAQPAANLGVSAAAPRRVAGGELFGLLQGLVAPSADASTAAPARSVDTASALVALDHLQRAAPELASDLVLHADSLRQFRASETGQGLERLDAITVDIVTMLFDMIFEDEAIADPIKILIGRLQIPVLKAALADRQFFSSRAHPARRLLDQISHAAAQLGLAAGREDALYGKLVAIVERLQREFSHDASLLDELCLELESFLAEQNRAADDLAAAGVPLAEAHERHLAGLAAAEQALAPYIAEAPGAIAELLGGEWRELLAAAHVESDLVAWDAALATASDLAASVKIAPGSSGRNALVGRLPGLVRRIQAGFDRLDVDPERRLQLIDKLFALHAALLAGDAKAAEQRSGAPPAPGEAAGEASLAQVARLELGNWVDLIQTGGAQRYRVSWVGPAKGVLLLTNPSQPRGLALSPQTLALRLERGQARIVPSEPIFDRAVVRALRSLSDEAVEPISLDFT